MTETRENKSAFFEKFQKQIFQLGCNPEFEKEKWVIPEGWTGRGEFESFEQVKKVQPKRILTVRDHKLVYVDLFGTPQEEPKPKIIEFKQEEKPIQETKKIITDFRDEGFQPTEDTPF